MKRSALQSLNVVAVHLPGFLTRNRLRALALGLVLLGFGLGTGHARSAIALASGDGPLDLAVDLTGPATAVPGGPISYSLTVTNLGPRGVLGARVYNSLPPEIASVSWTCSGGSGVACTAGPVSGDLEDLLDIEAGASAKYEIMATVAPTADGIISNTGSVVTGLAGEADTDPSNDQDTVETELLSTADVAVTLDDGRVHAVAGKPITYKLVVSNAGPSPSKGGSLLTSTQLEDATSFCTTTDGLPCGLGVDGGLEPFALPGEVHTHTIFGTVPAARSTIVAKAKLWPDRPSTDPNLGNNTAQDVDVVVSDVVQTLGAAQKLGDGNHPDIAFADSGNALVVFGQELDGVMRVVGRRLSALSELLSDEIDVSRGVATHPAVAYKSGDTVDFLAVWDERLNPPSRILSQLVRQDRLIGPRQVLSTRRTDQIRPDVAASSVGELLVVWESVSEEGKAEESGIFGRRLDRLGQPVPPPEQRIDVSHDLDPERPAIAADDKGNYLVIWDVRRSPRSEARRIVGQRLANDGELLGEQIKISLGAGNLSLDDLSQSDVTFDDQSGVYLAVWGHAGSADGVGGRRFDRMGQPLGEPFLVGKSGDRYPKVAAEAEKFVVVWERPLGERSVTFGQMIDTRGRPLGHEFRVNSTAEGNKTDGGNSPWGKVEENDAGPAVAFAPSGSVPDTGGTSTFLVVRDDIAEADAGQSEVWGQAFAISADLRLAVSDEPDPVLGSGENPLSYTVSVTNLSTAEAEGIVVTAEYFDGVTPILSSGCDEDPVAFDVCTLGTLEGGEVRVYTIETTVAAGLRGTLPLTARVTSLTPDPDEFDNTAIEVTRLGEANLSVGLVALGLTPEGALRAGDETTWRVTVRNDGPSAADSVLVSSRFSEGIRLMSTAGCAEDPTGASKCSLGEVESGEERQIEFVVKLPSDVDRGLAEVTQAVVVTAVTEDPDLSDNVASETVPLLGPSLAMALRAPPSLDQGSVVSLVLTVTNNGSDEVEDVLANLFLPPGTTFVSSSGCDEDPIGTPLCSLGGLSPSDERTILFEFRVNPGVTGTLRFTVRLTTPSQPGLLTATAESLVDALNPEILSLLNGRFSVLVAWSGNAGTSGAGLRISYSDNTGFFWFFQPDNVELLVKVLDGRPVNGNFWFFYAGLSDLEYDITVIDTETGAERMYHNEQGEVCGDTNAFPGAEGLSPWVGQGWEKRFALESRIVDRSPPVKGSGCIEGTENLCLSDGRFRVDVGWKDHTGGSGSGQAVTGTDGTGYFWFFNEDNLELVVKVLDGRQINGWFWFFYGAVTDIEFTITVTDTETGVVRQYHNSLGVLSCGQADVEAF